MKKLIIFLLFLILFKGKIDAQNSKVIIIPDSLKNISFKKFEEIANNLNIEKSIKSKIADDFLENSKKTNDLNLFVKSLYWTIRIDFDAKDVQSKIDFLIQTSSKIDDNEFPAKAHLLKSEYLLYKGKSIEGLSEAFIAEKMAKAKNNLSQSLLIKKQVGLINVELDRLDIALQQFLEYMSYYESEKEKSREYLYAIFMLTNIYNKLEQPDNALKYLKPTLAKISKNNFFYKFFILSKGISYYLKKNYKYSEALIKESINLLKNTPSSNSLATAYYFLGENKYNGQKKLNEAYIFFIKTDSLIINKDLYFPIFRNSYVSLIEISKKNHDKNQQLLYLNKLIRFDSILNKKYGPLYRVINEKYDTPHLLSEKENIIQNLNTQKNYFYLITTIVIIGFLLALWRVLKLKKDNQYFSQLIEEYENKSKNKEIENEEIKLEKEIVTKSFDLPKEITKDILEKLKKFEKNQEFLNPNLKQNDLAKEFGTNSNYLSKVINHYKEKNFNQYLNDLRIDFTVDRLHKDKKFRKYTIKAISEEVGFNNPESFSKAFYTKTSLQPSFFIKKITEISS